MAELDRCHRASCSSTASAQGRNGPDKPPIQALMDAQRAISLVRSKAAEWGIDPSGSACSASRPEAT